MNLYFAIIFVLFGISHQESISPTRSPSSTRILPSPSPETIGGKVSVDIIIDLPINTMDDPVVRLGYREGVSVALKANISDIRIRNYYQQLVPANGDTIVRTEAFFRIYSNAETAYTIIPDVDVMIVTINRYLPENITKITRYGYQNLFIDSFDKSNTTKTNGAESNFFESSLFWGSIIGGVTIISIIASTTATIYKCTRNKKKDPKALFVISDDDDHELGKKQGNTISETANSNSIPRMITTTTNTNTNTSIATTTTQESDSVLSKKFKLTAEEENKIRNQVEANLGNEYQNKLRAKYEAELKAEREARIKAEYEMRMASQYEVKLIAEYEAYLKSEQEAKLKAQTQIEACSAI